MKRMLISILLAGFLSSCGKISKPGLRIGKNATSILAPEKKCAIPLPETNLAKQEKDCTQMGFTAMSLPGRF